MAQRFRAIESVASVDMDVIDLLILPRGAFAADAAASRTQNAALSEWVEQGGSLLVFGIRDEGFSRELLPHEIRFATDDPSGWGGVDFSEEIADTNHPIYNRPHRLRYLAGLLEQGRVVYTSPEWTLLLTKNGEDLSVEHQLDNPPNDVGSIFECTVGNGRVLVCQPVVELYHSENASIVPHPLEAGVLLFENIVEYMKQAAADRPLPVARIMASPTNGPPNGEITFRAEFTDGELPIACEWRFGDGATGEGVQTAHSYSTPGIYWIKVRAVAETGEADYAACRVRVGPKRAWRWADHLADAFMHRYYSDPGRVGPNYRTALVLSGLLDVYERSGDTQILDYVREFFQTRLIERWDRRPYRDDMTPDVNFADIYTLMTPAWRVYKLTGDRVYWDMAREVWDQSLRVDHSLPPGLLWSPHTWGGRRAIVDFTYFKCQLRAAAWDDSGDPALLDEAAQQMVRFAEFFQDPSDGLFFMAVDMDHKEYFTSPDRPSGLNDSKWNRADGWVAMAFAELMPRLTREHPLYGRLEGIVTEFFTGIVHAQDPRTGLWALVVDRREYPGMWLETTGSCMYVQALCRLVETGVLPRQPFLDCARRGYNGLQQRIGMGHWDYPYLSDACQGTLPRLNLERWIQAHRHDNDLHVIGPYLMAEEALWRVAPPDVAVVGNLKAESSLAGQILNVGGISFFQVPGMYDMPDLGTFRTVVVERGAVDSNRANIAAYPDRLREVALNGGTVAAFSQQDGAWLEAAFPELKDRLREGQGEWLEAVVGDGRVIYCRSYPQVTGEMDEAASVAELRGFPLVSRALRW